MKLTFFHRGRLRWISHITNLLPVFAGLQSPYLKKNTNKHGVSRKFESLLSRISCPRRKKNDMVFLVGLCFFRMQNLALTGARTKMYWERRSISSCASMLLYKCCYLFVQDSIFCTLSISRQVHNRENLGQSSGDYPIYRQNLRWSAKRKIPDCLGFFRHPKSSLYFSEFTSLMAEQ